ncbi:MAG: UDP-N-acetylglucosamine 2-epimerase (non-hydrolyzing) [Acidobacteriota bacterium]
MKPNIKVAVVLGTRPEAIKLAPVIKRLHEHPDFEAVTLCTAQHREMLDQVLTLFRIRPDYDLNIMSPGQSLSRIITSSLDRLDGLYQRFQPNLVLVQGDTSTTFAASLAAFYHRIPVGHIEAGLRTGDRFQPYPEEMNRRLTSALADLHFAPTATAKKHLLAEGIDPKKIFVTGNTVIDALRMVREMNVTVALPEGFSAKRLILVTAHRRENQGLPLRSICCAVREIVDRFPDVAVVFPVHKNPQVRAEVFPLLGSLERVWLCDPLQYTETAHLLSSSFLVLTDSGGLQEEAPSLGKPVLVLRERTERPEAVKVGAARLVGTEKDRIVKEASALLKSSRRYHAMAKVTNPYGDGRATERIINAILFNFKVGRRRSRPAAFRPTSSTSG